MPTTSTTPTTSATIRPPWLMLLFSAAGMAAGVALFPTLGLATSIGVAFGGVVLGGGFTALHDSMRKPSPAAVVPDALTPSNDNEPSPEALALQEQEAERVKQAQWAAKARAWEGIKQDMFQDNKVLEALFAKAACAEKEGYTRVSASHNRQQNKVVIMNQEEAQSLVNEAVKPYAAHLTARGLEDATAKEWLQTALDEKVQDMKAWQAAQKQEEPAKVVNYDAYETACQQAQLEQCLALKSEARE